MFSNIVKSLDFVDCDGPLQSLTKSAKNIVNNDDFCGLVYAPMLKFKINVGKSSLQSGTADIASSPLCDLSDSSGSYWVSELVPFSIRIIVISYHDLYTN